MPLFTSFADISSPYETRTLFRILEKAISHTSKNAPACCVTHIGPEEKHLKCSSTRLKCNFGLSRALFFNHLQRPQNRLFKGYRSVHFIPLAILRGGLIRAKINDKRGASWEGRCSAARMPQKAKREVICDAMDAPQTERRIAHYPILFLSRRLAAAEGSGPPS